MLTPFTTNAEVRSVFGVSEEELLDATLNLPLYEANLRLHLRAIGSALPADFLATSALPEPLTDPQKDFVDAVILFAPYVVGVQLTGLPLFATKAVTDGKAGMVRNSESPFEKQINACKKNFEIYRQNLESAYATFKNQVSSAAVQSLPTLLSVVNPASDPVTGT